MGATYSALGRWIATDYGDGVSSMAGADRPSPRAISNAVAAQDRDRVNRLGTTDFLWQWGQFVDHDIDLTDGTDPADLANIVVPFGDPWFDPFATGDATIAFNRSIWDPDTGTDAGNPRRQLNEITGWIDASNVYGSSHERARALRTLDGTGRLKTSAGNLLPFNVDGLPNAGGSSATLYLAGDVRANEQVGLTALHTLFVREHNRLAIAAGHLSLRDAFFDPSRVSDEGGIEPVLRGLAAQRYQAIDPFVIDDVRNFLFGPPGAGGFDLVALNIQRGRDHGLPSYNDAREQLGLGRAATFAAITRDPALRQRLATAYASPDDVDLWVGALAEEPLPGSHLGPLNHQVVTRQFERLRDGDRFWYASAFSPRDRDTLEGTTLARVIRRNTGIRREIRDDVFRAAGPGPGPDGGH